MAGVWYRDHEGKQFLKIALPADAWSMAATIKTRKGVHKLTDCVFYPYFQGFMEGRSLLVVYVFTSPNSPERSPMERRAPAQSSSRDQCTRGPSSGTTRTQLLFKFY